MNLKQVLNHSADQKYQNSIYVSKHSIYESQTGIHTNHSADQKYHNILYMNLKQVLNHSADQKYQNILYMNLKQVFIQIILLTKSIITFYI